jgi:hypothetical protein
MSIIFVFYFLPFPFFSSHLFLSFYYSMSLSSFVTVLFCLPLYSLHCPILSYVTCRPPAMGAARAELAGRHILQLCRPGRRWSALSTGNEDRGATWHCDGGVLTVITINLRSSFVLGLTQTGMVRGERLFSIIPPCECSAERLFRELLIGSCFGDRLGTAPCASHEAKGYQRDTYRELPRRPLQNKGLFASVGFNLAGIINVRRKLWYGLGFIPDQKLIYQSW